MESTEVFLDEHSPSYRALSPEQLQRKINYKEALQLVDIRPRTTGNTNDWYHLYIPENELEIKYKELHQDIPVVLISSDGESAEKWCMKLNQELGFDNIYYLKGGLEGWNEGRIEGMKE